MKKESKANNMRVVWTILFGMCSMLSYGDKAPRSAAGRVFGLVWMVCGIILMAVFTATLTTAFQAVPEFVLTDVSGASVKAMLSRL